MLDTREILEKKFNKDTHRLIAENQLQKYSSFFERYNDQIQSLEKKLKHVSITSNTHPITISITPKENIPLIKLVASENKLLSRILISLSSVCHESKLLVDEAKDTFYKELVSFGEFDATANKEQNNGKHLSALFELLQRISMFVKRCQAVIILILQQLCALIGKKFYNDSNSSSFPEILHYLCELLVCLLTLDSLLASDVIQEQWKIYRRAVRAMTHNSNKPEEADKLRSLDKKLLDLEDQLLTGLILKRTLDKCLEEQLLFAIKNCNLIGELHVYALQLLSDLEKDDEHITFIQMWLQLNALFVLHYNLNGAFDKKLFKRVMDLNKKISACVVSGNIVWIPEEFILKHIPSAKKIIDLKAAQVNRVNQITQRTQNLQRESTSICIQAVLWFIQIEKKMKLEACNYKLKDLQGTCTILLEGVKIIKKISEFLKWMCNLHAAESRPMPKSVLLNLCKLVEVLIATQFVFRRNMLAISNVLLLIVQQLTHKILGILSSIKKSYIGEKTYKMQQLDVLSALVVAEKALKGPNTFERILITKLALSSSGLNNEILGEVRAVLQKLEFISNFPKILVTLTNCSFLYWHQVLFPVYFNKLAVSHMDLTRSYLLVEALSHSTALSSSTQQNAFEYIQKSIEPLREKIEANLRHQTHLHLQLHPLHPFDTPMPMSYRQLKPLHFSGTFINLRQDIEHYLSTMFYNLTTVVLHDWRTYGEMRRLAVLQYGLRTVEDNLPVQTLEQGLDVLEIMRNINVFVSRYMYNLNNQVFIEESNISNKTLNTINISHVANSIRTHGIGIMSTTVNFTYQFLQNKFYTFSQFMYDEQIKSRLLKDLRYFNEHKVQLNQMYPFARAEQFNHGIRKLGLDANGFSYLDLFRKLITQIGNAMGYIRLVRSGGKRCVADGACFLPSADLDDILLDDATQSDLSAKAARNFKREVCNLQDNFEEATEYFKLLVNAFAAAFRDPQNLHLRNFYAIIPPLTVNYVEHLLTCKDRLNKNKRDGCAFTDDGFAMGIAYIVALLDQGDQLDSLHWFQSIRAKHQLQWKQLNEQKSKLNNREDNKLQQTLSLTEKRLKSVEMEFQLLYYSFSSARIFFE